MRKSQNAAKNADLTARNCRALIIAILPEIRDLWRFSGKDRILKGN
jgi:hypothetical protein